MKQLIIATGVQSKPGVSHVKDYTTVSNGALLFVDLVNNSVIDSNAKLVNNFAVVCGRSGRAPIVFPEVDIKTLSVTKSTATSGAVYNKTVFFTSIVAGKEYTVNIVKLGTHFNERNSYTYSVVANSTTASELYSKFVNVINANAESLEITASLSSSKLILVGNKMGQDYNVTLLEDGVIVNNNISGTNPVTPILDANYVRDLASRCAAGKGFTDTYADGDSIYPGYPENVPDGTYTMFTLRFAVPRVAAKQRDEVVYQTLHICVPASAAEEVTSILLGESA